MLAWFMHEISMGVEGTSDLVHLRMKIEAVMNIVFSDSSMLRSLSMNY